MSDAQYCRRCGAEARIAVPPGDNRERLVCPACGLVQYDNPLPVVGCLLEHEGCVLLCRRAIEPRHGFWTLPAGFMEQGETLLDGALREAREEANAHGRNMQLFALYSLPHISQVYVMFRGTLDDGAASAGDETLEIGLFEPERIPWDHLAFPVVRETLERWLEAPDEPVGVHHADVFSRPGAPPDIVRHRASPIR